MAPILPLSLPLNLPLNLPLSLPEAFDSRTQDGGQAVPATPQDGRNGQEGGGQANEGSIFDAALPAVLIGAVLWFLVFAPERKARRTRQEMLGSVKKGDKIITTGGLHGRVEELKENEVVIRAGEARLTFSRSSIHEIVTAKAKSED